MYSNTTKFRMIVIIVSIILVCISDTLGISYQNVRNYTKDCIEKNDKLMSDNQNLRQRLERMERRLELLENVVLGSNANNLSDTTKKRLLGKHVSILTKKKLLLGILDSILIRGSWLLMSAVNATVTVHRCFTYKAFLRRLTQINLYWIVADVRLSIQ